MGPTAKMIVSVVILLVLVYQWAWDLPPDSVLRRLLAPVRRSLTRLGFGHSWQLYAPVPPSGSQEMRFEIDGRDGRRYVVPFPLDSYGPMWGRPNTRTNRARQSLGRSLPGYRRSVSRWIVDEYLPLGPARDREWSGPARVRCIVTRRRPPPLGGPAEAPPSTERKLFEIDLPAR
jgi:hypothetical protein